MTGGFFSTDEVRVRLCSRPRGPMALGEPITRAVGHGASAGPRLLFADGMRAPALATIERTVPFADGVRAPALATVERTRGLLAAPSTAPLAHPTLASQPARPSLPRPVSTPSPPPPPPRSFVQWDS